jgi:hemerythrin-like domain-containing protein
MAGLLHVLALMDPAPTLSDVDSIAAEHAVLKAIFQQHQEALVGLLYVHALADLEEFARRLHRHIRVEEMTLLPAYGALPDLPRAGAPEFFLQEHRKIEESLEEILNAMRSLSPGRNSSKAVVSIMERETRFKSLLEHHEIREEQFLFPRLKGAL